MVQNSLMMTRMSRMCVGLLTSDSNGRRYIDIFTKVTVYSIAEVYRLKILWIINMNS